MTDHAIRQQLDADGILLLTIDLPGTSMNVINDAVTTELATAAERLRSDPAVKGAVITSGKASAFVAGADLREMKFQELTGDRAARIGAVRAYAGRLGKVLRAIETCGKPVVAAVNGLALGGGLELALACHARILSDNPRLKLGLPEVLVGLLPGGGGTQRLPRLMGVQNALLYILQGKNMSAQEAVGFGVAQEVVPAAELVARAKAWVQANPGKHVQPWDEKGFRFPGGVGSMNPAFVQTFIGANAMAHKQSQGNLHQVEAILSAVYEGAQLPFDKALELEIKYFSKVAADPQAGAMIRSLFVSKQAAEKGARRPKGVPASPTRKLGVLGAGLMGSGIAMVSAVAGIEVVLLDRDVPTAEKGRQYSAERLAKRHTAQAEIDAVLARIRPTADFADLAGCDLIIEAVFENRDVKREATQKAGAVTGGDIIFASNTSTLPITGLAQAFSNPAHFIGIHFFSPVEKMPLVEIIVGKETGPEAIAKALDYAAQIRKTPIVVNDSRGFYTSRSFSTYVQEGLALLMEGAKPALIENVGRQLGMPVGPLAVNDEVGLDLSQKIADQARADLGDTSAKPPFEVAIDTMIELGRHGRKNGKGFYVYPEDRSPKYLWPDLGRHFPVAAAQPAPDAVRERLFYRQLVEVARCFAEGVIETPEDGDLGAIFGWGFAPYTGGPLTAIDNLGLAHVVDTLDRLTKQYGPRFAPPQLLRDMAAKGETFYGNAARRRAA